MIAYQEGATHVDGWYGTSYRKVSDSPLRFEYFSLRYKTWKPSTMVRPEHLVPVGDLKS